MIGFGVFSGCLKEKYDEFCEKITEQITENIGSDDGVVCLGWADDIPCVVAWHNILRHPRHARPEIYCDDCE